MAGTHLAGGVDYTCRFGDIATTAASYDGPSSSVLCAAPAGLLGVLPVTLSLNAQQYTGEIHGVAITFYDVDAERGIGAYGEPPPRDSPEPEIMPHEPSPSESRRDALLAITDAVIVDAMRTPENLTWSGPESGAE